MADPAISPPEAAPPPALDHSRRQLEALLDVSEIIAQHRDLNTLFHELAARLHSVVESDFLTLVLHDPEKNVMRLHVLESRVETEKTIGCDGIWTFAAAGDFGFRHSIHAARGGASCGGSGQRAEF
jgi:hypothetical protein